MLNKLRKAAHKAADVVHATGQNAKHAINKRRDHPELRDLITETIELRVQAQGYWTSIDRAITKLVKFHTVWHHVPDPNVRELVTRPLREADIKSVDVMFDNARLALEQLLKVDNPEPQFRHSTLRSFAGLLIQALQLQFELVHTTCVALMSLVESQFPVGTLPSGSSGLNPVGTSAPGQQGTLSNNNSERLVRGPAALTPWNEALAKIITTLRAVSLHTDRFVACATKAWSYCGRWCDAEQQDLPNVARLTQFFRILGDQFERMHLPDFRHRYELVFHRIEVHTSPTADRLPQRPQDFRSAVNLCVGAIDAFAFKGAEECVMFRDAMLHFL